MLILSYTTDSNVIIFFLSTTSNVDLLCTADTNVSTVIYC